MKVPQLALMLVILCNLWLYGVCTSNLHWGQEEPIFTHCGIGKRLKDGFNNQLVVAPP